MSTSSPLAALHAAAEAVRLQLQVNAFDAAAVQRLAEFIEAQRQEMKPAEQEGVLMALGCFLGQCLADTYGGTWAAGPDGTTGIGIGGKSFFNPFRAVHQQLTVGAGASVVQFFAQVPQEILRKQRNSWIK